MASAEGLQVDIQNRVLVGLLGPVAQALGLGHVPGDMNAAELVALAVTKIRQLREDQTSALVALHEQRLTSPHVQVQLPHDQQFRILNIDDEVVWSGEWKMAGEDGLQKLAAVNRLMEMKQTGTDFGMRVERYQRCRWVGLTTIAEEEP